MIVTTEHVTNKGQGTTRIPNRLINEKSPYLLQHAFNPVNWYPWGEEAFAKAKEENKPIFLSIGYSTCHWCHLMAKECFEDEEVAALLNESFIAEALLCWHLLSKGVPLWNRWINRSTFPSKLTMA